MPSMNNRVQVHELRLGLRFELTAHDRQLMGTIENWCTVQHPMSLVVHGHATDVHPTWKWIAEVRDEQTGTLIRCLVGEQVLIAIPIDQPLLDQWEGKTAASLKLYDGLWIDPTKPSEHDCKQCKRHVFDGDAKCWWCEVPNP